MMGVKRFDTVPGRIFLIESIFRRSRSVSVIVVIAWTTLSVILMGPFSLEKAWSLHLQL